MHPVCFNIRFIFCLLRLCLIGLVVGLFSRLLGVFPIPLNPYLLDLFFVSNLGNSGLVKGSQITMTDVIMPRQPVSLLAQSHFALFSWI